MPWTRKFKPLPTFAAKPNTKRTHKAMKTDTQKTLPRSITIIGRRWFQRTYGNTYHTAEIIIDGVTVHKTPKQYGYGSAYEDTAAEWLDQSGLVPPRPKHANGSTTPTWQHYREDLKIAFTAWALDVRREKDL